MNTPTGGAKLIRAKVWFRCAAMHDPVMPVLVRPAVIGWKAKQRSVDLVIEREFTGEELVKRMKGWITVDPKVAIRIFQQHGRLKCFDDGELVVEVEEESNLEALKQDLKTHFGDQCHLEPVAPES